MQDQKGAPRFNAESNGKSALNNLAKAMLDSTRTRPHHNPNVSSLFLERKDQKRQIQRKAQKYHYDQILSRPRSSVYLRKLIQCKLRSCPVPDDKSVRKIMWLKLSDAFTLKTNNSGLFQSLLKLQYQWPSSKQIGLDVKRTVAVLDPSMHQSMTMVLQAFSRRNNLVGYCQGLNFIVYTMLKQELSQEQSFWLLSSIIQQILPLDYFTNMMGVICDQKILQECVAILLPDVTKKLKSLDVQLSIFSIQWLICLTSNSLPHKYTVLVWDRLFCEGSKVLLKASLAIIQILQPVIMNSRDFMVGVDKTVKNINQFCSQDQFCRKIDSICIWKEELEEMRTKMRQLIIIEKGQQKFRTSRVLTGCERSRPFCQTAIDNIKKRKKETLLWAFRQGRLPKIIDRYWNNKAFQLTHNNQKQALISEMFPDIKQQTKDQKLLLGRQEHICIRTQECQFELKEVMRESVLLGRSGGQAVMFFERFESENKSAMALIQ